MRRLLWIFAAVPVALVSAWVCVGVSGARESTVSLAACEQYGSCPEYGAPPVSPPPIQGEPVSSPSGGYASAPATTSASAAVSAPPEEGDPAVSPIADRASTPPSGPPKELATGAAEDQTVPGQQAQTQRGEEEGSDDMADDGVDDGPDVGTDEGDEGTNEPDWLPDGTRVDPDYYRDFECREDNCGAEPVPDGWECVKFQTAQQKRPGSPFYAKTYIECKHPQVGEKPITKIDEKYCYYGFDSDGRLLDRRPCGPPADEEVGERAAKSARDTSEALGRSHRYGSGAENGEGASADGGPSGLITLTAPLQFSGRSTSGEGESEEDKLPPTEPVRPTLAGAEWLVVAGEHGALEDTEGADGSDKAEPGALEAQDEEFGSAGETALRGGQRRGIVASTADERDEVGSWGVLAADVGSVGLKRHLESLAAPVAGLMGEVGEPHGSTLLLIWERRLRSLGQGWPQ